nr:hypothetical protein [Sphingomonas laterariae]
MISALLRQLPAERLRTIGPADFHRWPVRNIVPVRIIRELIDNETARRK